MAESGLEPVRALVAGMVGSGSTYLFNVARDLLALDRRLRTLATYADAWSPSFEGRRHLVLKSHWGRRTLLPMAEAGELLSVVSVRHPGDCVCSDIERFGFAFDFALERVALSLAFAARLRLAPGALLFRYEDRFTETTDAAAALARAFGLTPDPAALAEIAERYDAAHVRAYAASLDGAPNLASNPDNPGDAWCPRTHIHRGHIGRQTSGRWQALSPAERAAIEQACGEDATLLGYGFGG